MIKNTFLFVLISFNMLIPNERVNEIINLINNGKFNFNEKDISNLNSPESLYLKGLIEIDGDKSNDYFIQYYNKYPNSTYSHDAVVRIAEYYYAKGLYVKSSVWYKKIPYLYPHSKHLNKSISYFLNALVISGKADSARYYARNFKEKYPKLKFTDEFFVQSDVKKKSRNEEKNETKIENIKFSVQVGTYKNYNSAISTKRVLSNEGFLSRIDEVYIKNQKMYSLRIGFYKKKSLAITEQNRLSSRLGIYDTIIVEVK